MKKRHICRIFIFTLILSVFLSTSCIFGYAEKPGITIDSVSCSDGVICASVQLSEDVLAADKMVGFTAYDPSNNVCAIRQTTAGSDGRASFSVTLDTTKQISGDYTLQFGSTALAEPLVHTYTVYATLADRISSLNTLISECESRGIPTDYEQMYINVAKRTLELVDETGISEEFIINNKDFAENLLAKAEYNLEAYLDGTKQALSVPKISPESIKVSGKNLVAEVSDDGAVYEKPVFLNGYNLGWEDRNESDFLNKIGVNEIPYSIEISRIIGKPNTAYKWENVGGNVASESSGTLHIKSSGLTGMMYQMVQLNEGEEYTVSFKAKGNSSENIYVRIGKSGETDAEQKLISSADWKEYKFTYTPTSTYKPEFRINCSGISDVYIEDISLKNSSGEELLSNGGFNEWFNDGDGIFAINEYALAEAKTEINSYREKGYAVVLSGNFSVMPSYITSMDGVKDANATYGTYIPYNPTHPTIIAAIKEYLDAVMPVATESGNVVCFMIHNEPSFNSCGKAFYNNKWSEYLKKQYITIDALNDAYNTSYGDYSEVPMQNTDELTPAKKLTRQYYDWCEFNDGILTEYHNTVADYIHKIAPKIPVGTKIMQEVSPKSALIQHYGTDYEAFGLNMDINANDGWARPDVSNQPIQAQLMWYDYQTSVNDAPVFNMENHFALDENTLNYNTDYASAVNAMLWQGAMHGLSGNQMWLWGRSDEKYPEFINTTVQYRSDVMAQIGKTGLDINRLSEEITAFREKPAKAAILFSEDTKSYNRQYEDALYQSYTASMYSGVKTDFIFESNIENLDNYDMLIIPEVTHTTDTVADKIYDFVQGGGKVLMLAEDCLKYNENGIVRDETKVNDIKSKAVTVSGSARNMTGSTSATVSNIENSVRSFYNVNGVINVELRNEADEAVSGVEIQTAEHSGKKLINLCNYNTEEISVKIEYNNSLLSGMIDLIDGTAYGEVVNLKPDVPVLLAVDSGEEFYVSRPIFGEMDFGDNEFSPVGKGAVSEEKISALTEGNIFARFDICNPDISNTTVLLTHKNQDMVKSISCVSLPVASAENIIYQFFASASCEMQVAGNGIIFLFKGVSLFHIRSI